MEFKGINNIICMNVLLWERKSLIVKHRVYIVVVLPLKPLYPS